MVDVALADFDEAPELREARKAHRDRFGGERVQHDIHAFSIGEFHDGFRKIGATRINHMLHSQRRQQRALRGAACAGDHLRAEMMRDLDRRHPHAARARMDEDALARLQVRHGFQRVPRGHEDHWKRRGFFKREAVRDDAHIASPRHRVSREAKHREAKHAVARRDVRHAAADRLHHASHFVAEDAGVRRLGGIERERLQHIAEIHARRAHFDHDFTRAALWQREGHQPQRIKKTTLAGLQPQRDFAGEHLLARLQPANDAPHVARLAAKRDLALGVALLQFGPEQRVVRSRCSGREVNATAGEIRMLICDHAHQADGGRLRQRHGIVASDSLRSARHHIHAQLRRWAADSQRLSQME